MEMGKELRPPASSHNRIRTEVVTTYEQLLHAYAIRSICFMEEHGVKAQQTFDGNDYQATHMIVYAGDEPIGTLRIRWFKDFAKIERMAFREAYRNTHVLKAFVFFVFNHIARKGYDKVIAHAQPKYARLWRIVFGFKNVERKKPLYFDGHEEPYIELVKELTPQENAISISTDPAVMFRTEGFWDRPSEYEAVA
jgi:acetyltransferase (GNAT) family protein